MIQVFEHVQDEVAAAVDTVEVVECKWPVMCDVVDWLPEIHDLEVLQYSLYLFRQEVVLHMRWLMQSSS